MEKEKKVFIVLTEYNDLGSDLTIVGVYDSVEASIEGVRKDIQRYIKECYTEEDIITCTGFDNENEMIESIIKTLVNKGRAIDPMDDLKVWYHSNPKVEHLDYEGKIREFLEPRPLTQLILSDENIEFHPMALDGSGNIFNVLYIMLDGKKSVIMRDNEGDFLRLDDQPPHKQKELYDKLKEKNLLLP